MAAPLYILGAGSMGLLLAARLQPVAAPVLLRRPGRWPARLQLTLQDGEARQRLAIAQLGTDALRDPVERLIVCTKAYDVLLALQGLGSRLAPNAALLLIQNGMGSQQAVVRAFPGCSVYAASSTEGAYRPAPDCVVHAGRGLTRVGRLQGEAQDWVGLLRAGGLDCEAVEAIDWHLAGKLRVNALINPLTVLHDCRNGELLERPAAEAAMRRLGAEADAVLAAAGYTFPEPAFEQAAAVARQTAANISSMLQDARAGRPLELEAITGHLLELAQLHGVPAPEHAALYAELVARAAGRQETAASARARPASQAAGPAPDSRRSRRPTG